MIRLKETVNIALGKLLKVPVQLCNWCKHLQETEHHYCDYHNWVMNKQLVSGDT